MSSYELSERLRESCASYVEGWSKLTACADDALLTEMLEAMEGADDFRKRSIAAAACQGPDTGTIYGIGASVNPEAQRYIRFVLATVDTTIRANAAHYGSDLRVKHVLRALRRCFAWVTDNPPYPLVDPAAYAKSTLVAYSTGDVLISSVREEINYLAGHYDALEPYLDFIVQSGDMSYSQLNMLLTTKPVLPLLGGLL